MILLSKLLITSCVISEIDVTSSGFECPIETGPTGRLAITGAELGSLRRCLQREPDSTARTSAGSSAGSGLR
jgi:hypothetical protein